ncbi:MAG: nucleoside recognition domain protein [Clostridia bacterium]|nr:nucleoside recognition domain protein [Clostridia bacterium]
MKIFNFRISKVTYLLLFIIILLLLITLGSVNFKSVKNTTEIFLSSVFPSLFPFILFTEITLKTGIISEIANYLSFIPKIFKLSKNSVMPILLGFLCGFPSGAKSVDTMLHNKQITKNDALILISFVNNCSPIFILTTVGIAMMNNASMGILLLIAHFSSSVIIGLLYSRMYSYNIIHEKNTFLNRYSENMSKNVEKEQPMYINMSKFEILQKSILNSFITLAFILGFMVIFNLAADITYTCLNKSGFINSTYILDILSGLFEVTRGAKGISTYPDYFNNILIISFLLGFSGLSIIFQVKSCLKTLNISINKLITFKLLHGILSVIVAYILLKYTNILNMSNLSVFSNIQFTEYYQKQICTSYIHSIALILLILSTYMLIKNESNNKLKEKQRK